MYLDPPQIHYVSKPNCTHIFFPLYSKLCRDPDHMYLTVHPYFQLPISHQHQTIASEALGNMAAIIRTLME